MKKVYGARICKSCRGICHEDSYRRKIGRRRPYWCSKNCLEWKIIKKMENKYKYLIDKEYRIDQIFLNHIIEEFYEKVDVITK